MSLKTIWKDIKDDWTWLKNKWLAFELWFNSKIPGLKIKIVNGLTAIGTIATALAAYMQQVPLERVISADKLAIALVVVTSLSFWLRNISDKAEEFDSES